MGCDCVIAVDLQITLICAFGHAIVVNPFRISLCCEGDPEKGTAHELRRSYSSIIIAPSGGGCGKQGCDDKVVSKKEHTTAVLRSKDKCRKQKNL